MMLTEDTPLPAEALPLAAFRAHLHLGTGFAEAGLQDDLLGGFLRAAMAAIEARTGKILLERAFTLEVSRWAAPNAQPLSMAPVKVITELVLRDPQGVETVVMPTRWYLEPDLQRPLLRAAGGVLPAIPAGGRAVVRLRAGMAADWQTLPADLAQAVLMLAAHFYEYRQETGLGRGCMPFGVTSLIERYRGLRLSLGLSPGGHGPVNLSSGGGFL
ncbi:MAG: head-tail connector protein [Rhodobacterales bacterium]